MTNLTWDALIRRWLNWQRAGGSRRHTLELRGSQLRRLARDHPDHAPLELGTGDLAAWLAGHDWAPQTLRSHRSALRSFYRWAYDDGLASVDPSRRLRSVRVPAPAPRAVAEEVLAAALRTTDPRVRLMLQLAAAAGMRRAEIAQVHTTDLVRDLDGWSLAVHGKGGRQRTVPLFDDGLVDALHAAPAGWVFPGRGGSHLTPAHVGKLMRRALDTATAHQLRHRYATQVYRATGDLEAVRMLLGHTSVATTQRYVSAEPGRLRRAAATAALPPAA